MRKSCVVVLIVICVLTGCISTSLKDIIEVRPGVYVANDASALPLPTSGYDIYVIGEFHGQREVHLFFIEYLKMLHKTIGLRDVVLEYPNAYERKINAYVLGEISEDVSSYYLGVFLEGVKAYNETLPEDEKIRLHAVNIDFPWSVIHEHLILLHEEIGSPAEKTPIPSLDEFEAMSKSDKLNLVEKLKAVTDDPSLLHELEIVRISIQGYPSRGIPSPDVREGLTTTCIQYVREKLDGAPILALYGGWHTRKSSICVSTESQPWAQRLTERGISIYSICTTGVSGEYYGRPSSGSLDWGVRELNVSLSHDRFADGTTLNDVFDSNPDYNILYIDLRSGIKISITNPWLSGIFALDIPPEKMFDGIVLLRKVTPLCQES